MCQGEGFRTGGSCADGCAEGCTEAPTWIDIQTEAMRRLQTPQYPGLKQVTCAADCWMLTSWLMPQVTETWLNATLDKTEQCSDWDARPLSQSQLVYAAADAAVLLQLALAMGLSPAAPHWCMHPDCMLELEAFPTAGALALHAEVEHGGIHKSRGSWIRPINISRRL